MGLLYRFITMVAALLVIIIGGGWLAHKYEMGPDLGWWDQQPDWQKPDWRNLVQRARTDDGVPAKELASAFDDISFSVRGFFSRSHWTPPEPGNRVLPVYYGKTYFLGFSSRSILAGGFHEDGGACYEDTVNLLVIDDGHPEGQPVFKRRVFLPRYFYFNDETGHSVAALVVSKDTNRDGRLDCGDEARLQVIDLDTDKVRELDRAFIPDDISSIEYDRRNDDFIFVEVQYANEDMSIRSIKIARQDLTVSETIAPDLLSKAREAFNRVEND